jgi:ABC-type phosphate transport system substrate-binding protein
MKKFAAVLSALLLMLTLTVSIHGEADYPIIDGSTSTRALDAAFKSAFLGVDYLQTYYETEHSKTFESFEKLLSGETDIILSVPITAEQEQQAKDKGFNLGQKPVAYEGFVFIVNPENPINSLSQSELRDIYSGRVTNWKELGFDDAKILAYQRNQNSGSQSFMNEFMREDKLMNPPSEWLYIGMGHIVDAVSDFDNSKYAIGYSVYSFALEEMAKQKNLKILAVDGISPGYETLSDNSYPLMSYTYAYYNADTDNTLVREVLDFMISEKGQQAAADVGYTPIAPLPSDSVYNAVGTGKPRPENYKPTREYSYNMFFLDEYMDGILTDSDTERKINEWLKSTGFNIKEGVYFTCVNGFMNVHLDVDAVDYYGFAEGSTSVWDLRTGERIEKFSDLFYEGEDFVPVVNRASENFRGDLTYFLKTEPKDFSTATLIFDTQTFNSSTLAGDPKDFAVNGLADAWDYMPAWEFYDMTPLFNKPNNLRLETADLYIEERIRYEDMLECYAGSSRFLTDSELAALNADIAKLYDNIKASPEYAAYEHEDEWDEPFSTNVDLSDENIITIRTPFGLFILNRETGVIDSPQTNPALKAVYIHGTIDIDLDGEYEYYTRLSGIITVYDRNINEIGQFDFDKNVRTIDSWQVKKEEGKISGRIIVNELTVFDYHIEDGVLVADGLKTLGIFDNERYYVKSGGFGNIEMEAGYPTMTANLKVGTESVIYLNNSVSGGVYLYEKDLSGTDLIARKVNELKKSGKPYVLVAGKEFIEITDIPDYYYFGAAVSVRHFSDGMILTELSDPVGTAKSFFSVYADGKIFYPFGKDGINATFANRKGISFDVVQRDEYSVNGKNHGETVKEYYFGYEDGEFFEYGSTLTELDEVFVHIVGFDPYLDPFYYYGFLSGVNEIFESSGMLTNIYWWRDEQLIINYEKPSVKNKNIIENHYVIVKTHAYSSWKYGKIIRRGKGHYLPSISASLGEDIARYPENSS